MIELPECHSVDRCPKCGAYAADSAAMSYHRDMLGTTNRDAPCDEFLLYTPSEQTEGLKEHLCRRCHRCGYGWLERVYQPPETPQDGSESPGDGT
jgi:hypothetical protein